MALTHWAMIVSAPGLDPNTHTTSYDTDGCKSVIVGVSKPEEGVAVAERLVADGVQLIELCGGFGPLWTAKILSAIDGAVPVGSVGYGPESVAQVHRIFAD